MSARCEAKTKRAGFFTALGFERRCKRQAPHQYEDGEGFRYWLCKQHVGDQVRRGQLRRVKP